MTGPYSTSKRPFDSVVLERVGVVLCRPWVWIAVLVAFSLLGLLFAAVLHYPVVDGNGDVPYLGTIAPDEHRHIANILFYAGRSVWAGPFIDDVPTRDLAMGEVLRFPSYAYYYVMSFPVKVLLHLGLSYSWIVVVLRVVNVGFGLLGLVATRSLLRAIGFSGPVTMLTVIVLAFTGRFVWQSAAVSYDPAAMTLFLCSLLYTVRFVRRPDGGTLAAAVVTGGWAIIVKYTFLPFVGVAVLLAVVLVLRRGGGSAFAAGVRDTGAALLAGFRRRTVRTVAWTLALLLGLVVFVERFGVNLLVYHQVNPDCTKLHSAVQCGTFDIYRRNAAAAANHALAVQNGQPTASSTFDLLQFAGRWCSTYLQSIFFYRDRGSAWQVDTVVATLGALVFLVACVVTLVALRSVLRTRATVWAATVAAVYIGATFVFNVRTYFQFDAEYAFSGRYLLPVLPIVFATAIAAALTCWRWLPTPWRNTLAVPVLLVGGAVVVTHVAPVAFFAYARDPSWYSVPALHVLPSWLTGS